MKRERLFNIPNALTGLRIVLIIVFIMVHFARPDNRELAISIFLAAGLTDCLDGYIARRFHQITWLGKLFDPLADKVMIIGAFICLMADHTAPSWLMGIIILKELYMAVGGAVLFSRDIVISSDWIGKAATLLFVPAVFMIYPWHDYILLKNIGQAALYASVALSVVSAVHYTAFAVKKSRGMKTD